VTYRGLVVGLRLAGVRIAGFFADAAVVRFFLAERFLAVGLVVVDPDDTRDECLGRWRTAFFTAPSATELSANEASSATSSIFIV
jgi:hypothetical protein